MKNKSIDLVEIATQAGNAVHLYQAGVDQAAEGLKRFNEAGITLHENKVTLGKSRRSDSTLQALYQALVNGGIRGNTASNYLTAFRQVVSTGKPLKGFNVNRDKPKAGTQVTPEDATKAINAVLRKLWNTEGIDHVLEQVEAAFNDAKADTLQGSLQYVMESRGIPFDDKGKATTDKEAK